VDCERVDDESGDPISNSFLRRVDPEQRIRPVRGIVLTQNASGLPYDVIDVKRWVRINRVELKSEKIDVFARRYDPALFDALFELAAQLDVNLSLRTDCTEPPDTFPGLGDRGFLDVFLCPRSLDAPYLDGWFSACREASLPIRLQVQAPFGPDFDVQGAVDRIVGAGVVVVNVVISDPFLDVAGCRNATQSRTAVAELNALAAVLGKRYIAVNLIGLPFCLVSKENLPNAENSQQFFLDHQQYDRTAYELASAFYRFRPDTAARALSAYQGRKVTLAAYVDERVFPWLIKGGWIYTLTLVWRKLLRKFRIIQGKPKPLPESVEACEHAIARLREKNDEALGPICRNCRLRRICDNETKAFKRALPGLTVIPQPGEIAHSVEARGCTPLSDGDAGHLGVERLKYYDSIDAARVEHSARYFDLAKEATEIASNVPPTREVQSSEYEIEGQWTHQMPGGNRWFSITNTEKESTVLIRTAPPLTVSVTFGGGIADYIGFSFGRHCKLLCPMETYSHKLVLHVDAEGYYVLLRDGVPVRPIEFEDAHYVPTRLAGVLEPRISICNIDGSIVTQTVLIWEGAPKTDVDLSRIKYSVLIVSTRYARRLQAVLLSIANQRGIDLECIEVIVSYVPGIDATDDLIDSMKLAYPRLRIVRSPFPQGCIKSKGFLINESVRVASGDWMVFLDSDTLIPPDMFAQMEAVEATSNFIAPDGRIMLGPEITGKILLGDIKPWLEWDELLRGPGEFRLREAEGVPIGFCQCVRMSCLDEVKYEELDHFEGADWFFGHQMREKFGVERRLSGVPVMHLDHGGSQWYGTQKHM